MANNKNKETFTKSCKELKRRAEEFYSIHDAQVAADSSINALLGLIQAQKVMIDLQAHLNETEKYIDSEYKKQTTIGDYITHFGDYEMNHYSNEIADAFSAIPYIQDLFAQKSTISAAKAFTSNFILQMNALNQLIEYIYQRAYCKINANSKKKDPSNPIDIIKLKWANSGKDIISTCSMILNLNLNKPSKQERKNAMRKSMFKLYDKRDTHIYSMFQNNFNFPNCKKTKYPPYQAHAFVKNSEQRVKMLKKVSTNFTICKIPYKPLGNDPSLLAKIKIQQASNNKKINKSYIYVQVNKLSIKSKRIEDVAQIYQPPQAQAHYSQSLMQSNSCSQVNQIHKSYGISHAYNCSIIDVYRNPSVTYDSVCENSTNRYTMDLSDNKSSTKAAGIIENIKKAIRFILANTTNNKVFLAFINALTYIENRVNKVIEKNIILKKEISTMKDKMAMLLHQKNKLIQILKYLQILVPAAFNNYISELKYYSSVIKQYNMANFERKQILEMSSPDLNRILDTNPKALFKILKECSYDAEKKNKDVCIYVEQNLFQLFCQVIQIDYNGKLNASAPIENIIIDSKNMDREGIDENLQVLEELENQNIDKLIAYQSDADLVKLLAAIFIGQIIKNIQKHNVSILQILNQYPHLSLFAHFILKLNNIPDKRMLVPQFIDSICGNPLIADESYKLFIDQFPMTAQKFQAFNSFSINDLMKAISADAQFDDLLKRLPIFVEIIPLLYKIPVIYTQLSNKNGTLVSAIFNSITQQGANSKFVFGDIQVPILNIININGTLYIGEKTVKVHSVSFLCHDNEKVNCFTFVRNLINENLIIANNDANNLLVRCPRCNIQVNPNNHFKYDGTHCKETVNKIISKVSQQ